MSEVRFDPDEADAGSLWTWTRYSVGRGRVERGPGALRLRTEGAVAGVLADAQLDDYHGRRADELPWRPPLRLAVRARWSHPWADLRGTTGFGFWNDPVDHRGRFVAAPSWLWFIHASAPSRLGDPGEDGGFAAAAMAGRPVNRLLLLAGNLALRLPGVGRLAVRAGEGRTPADAAPLPTDLDPTGWHDYALDWTAAGARFAIDGEPVAALGTVPAGPLGFVAWIDNNWAAVEAGGRFRSGRLDAPGSQWLELARVEIRSG